MGGFYRKNTSMISAIYSFNMVRLTLFSICMCLPTIVYRIIIPTVDSVLTIGSTI